MKSTVIYTIFLPLFFPIHAELLNAAEDITAYEEIALINEGEQILTDAQACLKEAQALVVQLKSPSLLSYIISFVYPAPSPDGMIERITVYISQLEQLRETTLVLLRRATDAKTFAGDVEDTLRKNMAAVGDAAYADPKKVYVYLFDPGHAGDSKAVEAATQRGREMPVAQIRDGIQKELKQESISEIRKKLLRQVGFPFRNEATKQEYDAYLIGTLASLVINQETQEKLMQQFNEIGQLKAELDEQKDLLSKIKGPASANRSQI